MSNVAEAYNALLQRWLNHYQTLPYIPFDETWQSICLQQDSLTDIDGEPQMRWQPLLNNNKGEFENIEQALEMTLHQDIKAYYTHLVSADLDLFHPKGPLTLLQIFNDDDFDTLGQNLIGHIMMKRQLKQRCTLFFAVTEQDDQMISLINDTGEIWLEYVGKDPHLKLADSMADFINQLQADESLVVAD